MGEIVKNWTDGGSLSVAYTGDGDGTAVITSSENAGGEREMEIRFVDSSRSVVVMRKVVQAVQQGEDVDDPNVNYLSFYNYNFAIKFRFSNDIEYRAWYLDGRVSEWRTLAANTWVELEEMAYTQLKGRLKPQPGVGIGTFEFITNDRIELNGNVMSLLFGGQCDSHRDLTGYDYAFYKLFYNCNVMAYQDIINDIDVLSPYCFAYMFGGDARHGNTFEFGIKDYDYIAPYSFYNFMSNLGMELYEDFCYVDCTKTAPHCFDGMFANTELHGIKLAFERLSDGCCDNMFSGCSSLTRIDTKMMDAPSEQYCSNWVDGVAESGIFVKNDNAVWDDEYGVSAIPEGWDVYYESDVPGGGNDVFSMVVALPSGENVMSEIYDVSEYEDNLNIVFFAAKESFEPIRNPLFLAVSEEAGILPWNNHIVHNNPDDVVVLFEIGI